MKTDSTSFLTEPTSIENTTIAQINLKPEQPVSKECRICLSSEDQGTMITPCQCAGSLKYVHEGCLREWFEVRVLKQNQDSSEQNLTQCELCKSSIKACLQVRRECRSKDEIHKQIKKRLSLFILCMIGSISATGVLIYIVTELVGQIKFGYSRVQSISKGMVLGALPVLLLLLCYFIYNLTFYFSKKKATVEISNK